MVPPAPVPPTPAAGPSWELYRHGLNVVGTFRCHPGRPEFSGGWMDKPTMVFPRTCVRITQEGSDTIVADANTVVLYRGQQEYARQAVDQIGDHCEWFEVDPSWLREAAVPFEPELAAPEAPAVSRTHGPVGASAYALQRALTRHLARHPDPDPLLVEETMARLVGLVIPRAYARSDRVPPHHHHRALVDEAKTHLALHYAEPVTLTALGATVGASRAHLARLFRKLTGTTVHAHLTALRLRAALDRLDQGHQNLTTIACDVGFSSPSHFSAAFHSAFGVTPSAFRAGSGSLLSTILTA